MHRQLIYGVDINQRFFRASPMASANVFIECGHGRAGNADSCAANDRTPRTEHTLRAHIQMIFKQWEIIVGKD